MGALENQIRENESFDSLMELYKLQLEENRKLKLKIKELENKNVVKA